MRKYKLPIAPVIPFKINPQDIIYPRRGYRIEYRRAVEAGQFCDYDSFIIDITEKGVLAEFLWLARYGNHYPIGDKELYVFMRRWGILGDKTDRRFKTISNELGIVSCGESESWAKSAIRRVYTDFHKSCPRVKSQWDYGYEIYRAEKDRIAMEKITYEI
jgi:hypothetical protein